MKISSTHHATKTGLIKRNPSKLKYVLTRNNIPLSYFYPNGNGDVKDIIGFSWNNYIIFSSRKEAEDKKESMLRQLYTRQGEILVDTDNKVRQTIKNLKIGWLNEN